MNSCPCHSGLSYSSCCQPYHLGTAAPNARSLMRSRYAAYALRLSEYIILTTHSKNPAHQSNTENWKKELEIFSSHTNFTGLKILDFEENEDQATVTFHASLTQGIRDTSFTEKSRFLYENGKWLYLDGIIS